jgi:hypothetical protein
MHPEAEPRGWLEWAVATPEKIGNYFNTLIVI